MTLNLFVRSTLLAALLVLASCAGGPGKDRPKAAAQAGWSNREAIGQAIHELNGGAVKAARKRLKQLLKRQPNDTVALSLMKQIDTPPQTLLGVENFAYTTREGDTMSELAKRFLGDPMLFYALARYNEIAAPGVLPSGRTLRIPGRARREQPTPTRRPPTTPEPRAPSERAPSES
ncbi:MAG: hypothetical protein JWN59_948, partial [Sphingomonas bacterium]|nr:hypothetical protein [Sphingomonas bacterium]